MGAVKIDTKLIINTAGILINPSDPKGRSVLLKPKTIKPKAPTRPMIIPTPEAVATA